MGEFPKIDWRALAEKWDKDCIEEPVGIWVGGYLTHLTPEERAAALEWNRRVNELANARRESR